MRMVRSDMNMADSRPKDGGWTIVIHPRHHWLDLRLGELWRFRYLISLFVWRDFVTYYKQTILGPLWYLIQPLLTTLTFTVIFGKLAGLSTDGLPQFLFYMAGAIVWSYFSSCLMKTSNTFVSNAGIFGKVNFPRLTVPISILFSNLITLTVQFFLFLGFVTYFGLSGANIRPNACILLTPLLFLLMAGLGLGFGIIVSSLTTRYRDLQFLVSFGVQLWMYATPVIYPLSQVPEQYRWIILANPMTPILEAFRYAYLGAGIVNVMYLLYSFCFMVGVLFIGVLIFNRVERTFMDTV
jgi:lipopolysaccharide transport system permease protein